MVPIGASGKKFIDEIFRLLNLWANDTPLKNTALNTIHVMPALLLQNVKDKRAPKSIRKKTEIVGRREHHRLVNERKTIQDRLSSTKSLK